MDKGSTVRKPKPGEARRVNDATEQLEGRKRQKTALSCPSHSAKGPEDQSHLLEQVASLLQLSEQLPPGPTFIHWKDLVLGMESESEREILWNKSSPVHREAFGALRVMLEYSPRLHASSSYLKRSTLRCPKFAHCVLCWVLLGKYPCGEQYIRLSSGISSYWGLRKSRGAGD